MTQEVHGRIGARTQDVCSCFSAVASSSRENSRGNFSFPAMNPQDWAQQLLNEHLAGFQWLRLHCLMTKSGKMTSGTARASLSRYTMSCMPSHFQHGSASPGAFALSALEAVCEGGMQMEQRDSMEYVMLVVLPLTFHLPFVSCDLEKLQDISSFSPYLVCDAHFWGHDDFISFPIPVCCFEEILLWGSNVFILEVVCQMDCLLCDQKDTFCYIFISRLF